MLPEAPKIAKPSDLLDRDLSDRELAALIPWDMMFCMRVYPTPNLTPCRYPIPLVRFTGLAEPGRRSTFPSAGDFQGTI